MMKMKKKKMMFMVMPLITTMVVKKKKKTMLTVDLFTSCSSRAGGDESCGDGGDDALTSSLQNR